VPGCWIMHKYFAALSESWHVVAMTVIINCLFSYVYVITREKFYCRFRFGFYAEKCQSGTNAHFSLFLRPAKVELGIPFRVFDMIKLGLYWCQTKPLEFEV